MLLLPGPPLEALVPPARPRGLCEAYRAMLGQNKVSYGSPASTGRRSASSWRACPSPTPASRARHLPRHPAG